MEGGINFFDTADVYSMGVSEEVTGRALREFAGSRESYVLATKVFFPMGESPLQGGLSRKHILHAIDNSLKRLGTDYVDLYQIHRFDPTTPIEETVEALHDVVKAGKARYIGASSMYAWQFAKYLSTAQKMGKTRFVSMQNHYNLIYREEEREMLPLCRDQGIAVIPWSPLARGFLAGNRRRQDMGETARAKSDEIAHNMYYQDSDFCRGRCRQRHRTKARRAECAGRACVAAVARGCHRPNHRRVEDATSRRRDRGRVSRTQRGRDQGPVKALHAASRAGSHISAIGRSSSLRP